MTFTLYSQKITSFLKFKQKNTDIKYCVLLDLPIIPFGFLKIKVNVKFSNQFHYNLNNIKNIK